MRKSPLSLADLADAIRLLQPSQEGARQIASLLGFTLAPVVHQPLPAETKTLARRPEGELLPLAEPPPLPSSGDMPPKPATAHTIILRQLHTPEVAPKWPSHIQEAEPLEVRAGGLPSSDGLHPLIPAAQLRAFARAAAGQVRPSEMLDVDTLVEQLARCRLQDTLPRRSRVSIRGGVQVLVQVGAAMRPFQRDVTQLRGGLSRILGTDLVEEQYFEYSPLQCLGRTRAETRPYRPPCPGTTVLLLTDLGIGRKLGQPYATADTWIAFAEQLQGRACPVTAVVPYGRARWPRAVLQWMTVIPWAAGSGARAREELEAFKLPLALAASLDPVLLRAARRRFAPLADPGLEADLLFDPEIGISNALVSSFTPEALQRLREELRQRPEMLRAAWAFLHAYREQHPANDLIALEELLVYQGLDRTPSHEGAVRDTLASLMRTLLREQADSGLARWVLQGLPELPEWIQRETDAGYLRSLAALQLGARPVEADATSATPLLLPESVPVGVAWTGERLLLREPPQDGDQRIDVPGLNPRVVFLARSGDSHRQSLILPQHGIVTSDPLTLPVELHTLAGGSYRVEGVGEAATVGAVSPIHEIRQLKFGEGGRLGRIAWSPDGRYLAAPSSSMEVQIYDAESGQMLRTLTGHTGAVMCVAWSPDGERLASGSSDKTVRIWNANIGECMTTYEGHKALVAALAWAPDGHSLVSVDDVGYICRWDSLSQHSQPTVGWSAHRKWAGGVVWSSDGSQLATCGKDGYVRIWDGQTANFLAEFVAHGGLPVYCTTYFSDGRIITSGGDHSVCIRTAEGDELLAKLEGHTSRVLQVTLSSDGQWLASRGENIRIWRCSDWAQVGEIPLERPGYWAVGLAFHPSLPMLAAVTDSGSGPGQQARVITVWKLDMAQWVAPADDVMRTATAKVVIVSDWGTGKTSIAQRLAELAGNYTTIASTGSNGWLLENFTERSDGTTCEIVMWEHHRRTEQVITEDLYEADLVLLITNPSDVDFRSMADPWLARLREAQRNREHSSMCPVILVNNDLDTFIDSSHDIVWYEYCDQHSINHYFHVDAKSDDSMRELLDGIQITIEWDRLPLQVASVNFVRLRNQIFEWKRNPGQDILLTLDELQERLQDINPGWQFGHAELKNVLDYLAAAGLVYLPDIYSDNSLVLADFGLIDQVTANLQTAVIVDSEQSGFTEENYLCRYRIKELGDAPRFKHSSIINDIIIRLLKQRYCLRSIDPQINKIDLIFPLLALNPPSMETSFLQVIDIARYVITGATLALFPTLVTHFEYTSTFHRSYLWHNQAIFEDDNEKPFSYGFRLVVPDPDNYEFAELIISINLKCPHATALLFQGLVESVLSDLQLHIQRIAPVACSSCNTPLDMESAQEHMERGEHEVPCTNCGKILTLEDSLQMTQEQQREVAIQRRIAGQRVRFETALFRICAYVREQEIKAPQVFISYARDDGQHRHWIMDVQAADLRKAGIVVLLNPWHGYTERSFSSYDEWVLASDYFIAIGTPSYGERNPTEGKYAIEAEIDRIAARLQEKANGLPVVLPILLDGTPETAFWSEFRGHIYADVRDRGAYLGKVAELILGILGITADHTLGAGLLAAARELGPLPELAGAEPLPKGEEIEQPVAEAATPEHWVLVVGSGNDEIPREVEEASRELGERLAVAGVGLVTGGWPGVDQFVTESYGYAIRKRKGTDDAWIQQYLLVKKTPAWRGGKVTYCTDGSEITEKEFEQVDVVVLLGGLGASARVGRQARERGIPVVPVLCAGASLHLDAHTVFNEMSKDWEKHPLLGITREEFASLDGNEPVEAAMQVIGKLLAGSVEKGREAETAVVSSSLQAPALKTSYHSLGTISLAWYDPNAEGQVSDYQIEFSLDNLTWIVISPDVPATEKSYKHQLPTPLVPNTVYYYRIRAHREEPATDIYSDYQIAAGVKPVLKSPKKLRVTEKAVDKLTITWRDTANAPSDVQAYRVEYNHNGGDWIALTPDIPVGTKTAVIPTPTTAGKIQVRVRAYSRTTENAYFFSANSLTVTESVGLEPPVIFSELPFDKAGKINLFHFGLNAASKVDEYTIQFKFSPSADMTGAQTVQVPMSVVSSSAIWDIASGLLSGIPYYFYAVAQVTVAGTLYSSLPSSTIGPVEIPQVSKTANTAYPATASGKPEHWVLVVGSGTQGLPREIEQTSRELGRRLADAGLGLVTGGWQGVDALVTEAFNQVLQRHKLQDYDWIQQYLNVTIQSAYPSGQLIYCDTDEEIYTQQLERADAVVLLGGLGATAHVGRLARERGIPVVPILCANTLSHRDAHTVFNEMLKEWEKHPLSGVTREEFAALDRKEPVTAAMWVIQNVIEQRAAAQQQADVDIRTEIEQQYGLSDEELERLAQAIHQQYLGTIATMVQADDPTPQTHQPWESLDEGFRESDRRQAGNYVTVLHAVGYGIGPKMNSEEPVVFTPTEIEVMAEIEHQRWMEEKYAIGWVYGDLLDGEKKHHPCLLDWDLLPEKKKEENRDFVRHIPQLLAKAGLTAHPVRMA
ncbi:MAG: WD40 domain-containing protein [Armatimonadota bacterium]